MLTDGADTTTDAEPDKSDIAKVDSTAAVAETVSEPKSKPAVKSSKSTKRGKGKPTAASTGAYCRCNGTSLLYNQHAKAE